MIPSAPVIRGAIALLRYLPVSLARGLAAVGGTVAWVVQKDRRETLLESLRYTAPERSQEHGRLARRTFRNLAVLAVDQFRLPSIDRKALQSLFEIRGLEHIDSSLARGKGVVIVTAHLGPYELASACFATMGYPVSGMVENLDPELLDALAAYRSATGMKLVNMKDGLRGAYRVLGNNECLALVADRAIGEARGAVEVPFAGGVRPMPIGPAIFAQATGAAIVTAFASINPRKDPRYLMEFDPPMFAEGRDEGDRMRLMSGIVERMEAAIRRNPDQWFVFQPNWVQRERA